MLADGGREAAPARHLVQRTVVAAEIAMAVVLVVGASRLGETMFRLLSQPLGFDPSNLVVVQTRFTGSDVPADLRNRTRGDGPVEGPTFAERTAAVRLARTHAIVERLSVLPGVVHAAAIGAPPFSTRPSSSSFNATGLTTAIRVDGRPPGANDRTESQAVTAAFAETLGLRVLEGRGLEPADGQAAALVSREFARRYFDGDAVGRRFESAVGSRTFTYEVVGVVEDLKRSTFADDATPTYYTIGAASRFALRTAGDPGAVLSSIRQAMAEVDPQIVVTSVTTMDTSLAEVIAAERFRATLSTAFALTALFLASVGLYGVAARRVADRRRELGIRVALGARPSSLGALVLGDTSVTVALGLSVGLPAAFAASNLTRSFLFGVSPTAPHVFAGAWAVLAAAALVAAILPARRASRVDPLVALRE